MEEKEKRIESSKEAAPVDSSSEPDEEKVSPRVSAIGEGLERVALISSEEYGVATVKGTSFFIYKHIEPDVEVRLRAIKPPEGRVIREGDYPPMQAVKREDGTWVLIKREKPTTFWGRVKALLF